MSTEAKQTVHEFWQRASCGEEAYAVAARVNVLGRRPVRATCDQSVGRGGNVSAVAGLNSYQPGPPCRTPHPCMGPHTLGVDNRDLTAEVVPRAGLAGANTILRRRVPSSLPQQTAAAVVQQISSVVIKQVISAAALNLACRTRKRWPPDNQPRGSRRTAMTI
jgi:hypothetical protein